LHKLYLWTCLRSDRAYRMFLDYGGADKKLCAEITPTYADLDADGFRHIDNCLPGVQFVLIARNPVDRFVSQVRMDRRYGKRRSHKTLSYLLAHPHYRRRGDYKRTLVEAEKAIGSDRILVVFFERLFDVGQAGHELERICEFLGISYMKPSTDQKSNAAKDHSFVIDDEQRREVARHYADVMDYMARYGDGLPASWLADLDRL